MRLSAVSSEWKSFNGHESLSGYRPYEVISRISRMKAVKWLSAVWKSFSRMRSSRLKWKIRHSLLWACLLPIFEKQPQQPQDKGTKKQPQQPQDKGTKKQPQQPLYSSKKLCVLRLPHDSKPRASGDHARSSSSRRLCVLRLPHDSQPRASDDQPRAAALPNLDSWVQTPASVFCLDATQRSKSTNGTHPQEAKPQDVRAMLLIVKLSPVHFWT